ncbi:Rft-1-domain-containing protein [Tuber magnatum]|uniref:Man(5)GlcNAc(2)-PP-dolichol translocation protein RFT1 n=1 Tax=Tuber magnatum TaxID=42249 RepID=A0A317SN45_9PEZI|nr:Rft-1-domain-containing protein [Tuber magnatum]
MSSKPPKRPPPQDEKENRQSLLSASAEGAKFLILLQVASRLLTFLVNQLLLQYLSPSLLGISVQLELFMISILYFSRESLRTALQRTLAAHHQTVINLSLLTLPLGLLFAATLSLFYARSFASSETVSQPFFFESVCLYALATIIELAVEPYFALAQLGLRYKVRAAAESAAAFARCILTCGVTVAVAKGCGSNYHLTYFHKPLTSLAMSMWLQSALKHLLTQGDSLLITYFTTNHAQGIYALSSNYGSLIARMLFQPIEESSRNLFAKLLSSTTAPSRENITSAKITLQTLIKLYLLLSTFFTLAKTLSAFCYYIPLLAINGVTEAFVQSVANERELAGQSAWMFAFSLGFATVGWVFLRVLGWGAQGLVAANGVNMLVRILWSAGFVRGYFTRFEKKEEEERGKEVEGFQEVLPGWVFLSAALGVGVLARGIVSGSSSGGGNDVGVVKMLASAGGLGVVLLGVCAVSERAFFIRCYRMVKSRGE